MYYTSKCVHAAACPPQVKGDYRDYRMKTPQQVKPLDILPLTVQGSQNLDICLRYRAGKIHSLVS